WPRLRARKRHCRRNGGSCRFTTDGRGLRRDDGTRLRRSLLQMRRTAGAPPSLSAWQPSLASRANSETFRTKDPKQIDRAVDASFTPAFHLAVANQAIQSRPGPAIIGSLDEP